MRSEFALTGEATEPAAGGGSPARGREILPITGIRFPITLAVLMLHVVTSDAYRPAGYERIPLFFVISGFVMSAAYYSGTRALSLVSFWRRRIARLYPMLLVTSLPVAFWFYRDSILPTWHGGHAGPAFARTVLLGLAITVFPPLYATGIQAPCANAYGWFVIAELSVGMLFPLGARWFRRMNLVPSVIAFLVLPGMIGLFVRFRNLLPDFYLKVGHIDLRKTPLIWLVVMFFGAAAYRVLTFVRTSPRTARAFGWAAGPLLVTTLWIVYADAAWTNGPVGTAIAYLVMGLTLVALAACKSIASKVLSAPILLYLGRRSFSIYMVSAAVRWNLIPLTIGTRGMRWINEGTDFGTWLGIVLVCVVGAVAYRVIELPAKDWVLAKLEGERGGSKVPGLDTKMDVVSPVV